MLELHSNCFRFGVCEQYDDKHRNKSDGEDMPESIPFLQGGLVGRESINVHIGLVTNDE